MLDLAVPGDHNVMDACAAYLAAVAGSAPTRRPCSPGSPAFGGARRRFEVRGEVGGVTVVDDYAHNPAKVAAVVGTASEHRRRAGRGSLRVVFQPHLYSRTRDFAAEFARALAPADQVVLLDVYGAREQPVEGVTSALVGDPLRRPARPAHGARRGPPAPRPSRPWPTPPGPATSCSRSGPATSPPSAPMLARRPARPHRRGDPMSLGTTRRHDDRGVASSANRFRERALSNRRRPWRRALLVVLAAGLAGLLVWVVGWSTWLGVDDVEVTGVTGPEAQAVARLVEVPVGTPAGPGRHRGRRRPGA